MAIFVERSVQFGLDWLALHFQVELQDLLGRIAGSSGAAPRFTGTKFQGDKSISERTSKAKT